MKITVTKTGQQAQTELDNAIRKIKEAQLRAEMMEQSASVCPECGYKSQNNMKSSAYSGCISAENLLCISAKCQKCGAEYEVEDNPCE